MQHSFTLQANDDYASIVASSYVLDWMEAPLELDLGARFSDPMPSLLSSVGNRHQSTSWLQVACWLSAEMALVSELVENRDHYRDVVAQTFEHTEQKEAKSVVNDALEAVSSGTLSVSKTMQYLTTAAYRQRLLDRVNSSEMDYEHYLAGISALSQKYGVFDFSRLDTDFEQPGKDEFDSTIGTVGIYADRCVHLSIVPGGTRGKSIKTDRGRTRIYGDALYLGEKLVTDREFWINDPVFDQEFLEENLLLIAQEYLSANPKLDAKFRENGAIFDRAIEWAQRILPERMDLWLRKYAVAHMKGRPFLVHVDKREMFVVPWLNGTYSVKFATNEDIVVAKANLPVFTFSATILPLKDGHFGVVDWEYRDGKSWHLRDNNGTRVLRQMALDAVKAYRSLDIPFEYVDFEEFNPYTEEGVSDGLSKLGNRHLVWDMQRGYKKDPLSHLHMPKGFTMIGPPTLVKMDLSSEERYAIRQSMRQLALERRYGSPITEINHNYFLLRSLKLDLSVCVDIMVHDLGMNPPTDNRTFETDIRAIRRLLEETGQRPDENGNLLDLRRARELRIAERVRRTPITAKPQKQRSGGVNSINEIRRLNKEAMTARLEKLRLKQEIAQSTLDETPSLKI